MRVALVAGGAAAAAAAAPGCVLRVPASDGKTCAAYDLSVLKTSGYAINGTASGGATYLYFLNFCGNVDPKTLPAQCAGKAAAPAYQADPKGQWCLPLGNLSQATAGGLYSGMSVPADWSDAPDTGAKLVYAGGTNEEPNSPPAAVGRKTVFKFVCDDKAGVGTPTFTDESPSFTYNFEWRTASACSPTQESTPCPIHYEPTWESLSMRERPAWFDDFKFGIFMHWGMYSVPSFHTEWYVHQLMGGTWGSSHASPNADFVKFQNKNYGCTGIQPDKYPCQGANFTFPDFAPMFKAELFEPDAWAQLFKNAGARYIVLTSKHHEGFCLWPSAHHNNTANGVGFGGVWNSQDIGPHRDLVGDLSASVRKAGLTFGVYHSQREWYHPLYLQDNDNGCKTTDFVDKILLPTYKDLVQRYQPDVLWADGAGDAPCTHDSVKYWKAPELISWVYNNAPNKDSIIVNSRWGTGSGGDYSTGGDRFTPGKLLSYKWESCFTVQKSSWGYDRTEDISKYFSTTALVQQLVNVVSTGGNLLLNVGPTADGRIVPAFEDRLLGIGAWLKVNGEAIYGTRPWAKAQEDTSAKTVMYTSAKGKAVVYAISFAWPKAASGVVTLTQPTATADTTVSLLGYSGSLSFKALPQGGMAITVPQLSVSEMPCEHAWVFALHNVN